MAGTNVAARFSGESKTSSWLRTAADRTTETTCALPTATIVRSPPSTTTEEPVTAARVVRSRTFCARMAASVTNGVPGTITRSAAKVRSSESSSAETSTPDPPAVSVAASTVAVVAPMTVLVASLAVARCTVAVRARTRRPATSSRPPSTSASASSWVTVLRAVPT